MLDEEANMAGYRWNLWELGKKEEKRGKLNLIKKDIILVPTVSSIEHVMLSVPKTKGEKKGRN